MLFFFPPDMARPASLIGDSSEHLVADLASPDGHARSGHHASNSRSDSKVEHGQHAATAIVVPGVIRKAPCRHCRHWRLLGIGLLRRHHEQRRR